MEYLIILLSEIYKILFLLVPVLVSVAMVVWLDRRVWAFVQKRRGPNVVGPFGLFQSLADALKYVFKEIIIPASSNKVIFILAPIVTMTLALIAWAVIPFSDSFVLADINVGILYLFAVSSLGVYGIIMGGWLSPIDLFPFNLIPGPLWMIFKILFLFILFALVKATVPRYRYDQLMKLGWKVFLPLSLIWVVLTASYLFYFDLLPVN